MIPALLMHQILQPFALSANVVGPLAVMGGLGLAAGILLTVAARVFHVEVDPKVSELREALPGVNCGACGYVGCDAYAEAVAASETEINRCIPGGQSTVAALAAIMGVEAGDSGMTMVARVRCQGDCKLAKEKYIYTGLDDCFAAAQVFDGHKACSFGCLGHGNCRRACPFNAIDIVDGIAVIREEACRACRRCVAACPKQLIEMVDISKRVTVLCRSEDRGNLVRGYCETGCIGCTRCVRACDYGAIRMEGALAVIDWSLCVNCKACVAVCPTHAIRDFDAAPIDRSASAATKKAEAERKVAMARAKAARSREAAQAPATEPGLPPDPQAAGPEARDEEQDAAQSRVPVTLRPPRDSQDPVRSAQTGQIHGSETGERPRD